MAGLAEDETEFVARCTAWMSARLDDAERDDGARAGTGAWYAWVAERAGAVCGTAWLQMIEKLPNPVDESEWHGYVSSLFVTPEARGQGVGTALLEAVLENCEQRGVDAVLLWPTPRSRTLYERHGFAVRDDLLERRTAWTT